MFDINFFTKLLIFSMENGNATDDTLLFLYIKGKPRFCGNGERLDIFKRKITY